MNNNNSIKNQRRESKKKKQKLELETIKQIEVIIKELNFYMFSNKKKPKKKLSFKIAAFFIAVSFS